MSKSGLWMIAAVAIITLLALVYLALTFEPPQGTTTVVLPNPTRQQASEPQEQESDSQTSSLPRIQISPPQDTATATEEPAIAPQPIQVETSPPPEPEADAAVVQLPSLNSSDGFVLEGLRAIANGAELVRLLTDEQLVRRFVVLVENVSRGDLPQTELPYQGMDQEMPVRTVDENLFVMDAAAFARFDPIIDTFIAIDTDAAMAFYRTLSPLFQQAYAEIGFRDVSFDQTLRRAIDNVLQAEAIDGPLQLVKPSVMYLYADGSIEDLSAVHKQLIRLGPENTAKLKDKLRQFGERL